MGLLVKGHREIHTPQLAPEGVPFEEIREHYYAGKVYSWRWIAESVRDRVIKDREKYLLEDIPGILYNKEE